MTLSVKWPMLGHQLTQVVNIREVVNGLEQPLNLTGAQVRLEIRTSGGGVVVDGTVTDAANGVCQFTLTKTGALAMVGSWKARTVAIFGEMEVPSELFSFVVE